VQYLVETHYAPHGRPLRRCHPRDLLQQIKNYCTYYGRPMELRPDYLDRVVSSYFTVVADVGAASRAAPESIGRQGDKETRRQGDGPTSSTRCVPPLSPCANPSRLGGATGTSS
jgi:hypothetical protein